jgi:hypothetical protein
MAPSGRVLRARASGEVTTDQTTFSIHPSSFEHPRSRRLEETRHLGDLGLGGAFGCPHDCRTKADVDALHYGLARGREFEGEASSVGRVWFPQEETGIDESIGEGGYRSGSETESGGELLRSEGATLGDSSKGSQLCGSNVFCGCDLGTEGLDASQKGDCGGR